MYGEYKGYPQQYDTGYSEDIEGSNQYFYEYSNEPAMMMNQPRMNRNPPQFRNQNYTGYQMNLPMANNIPNFYNKSGPMYGSSQPKNIYTPSNIYPPHSPQYSQVPANHYQSYQQASPHTSQNSRPHVSAEVYDMLVKQYKLTLKMMKAQNDSLTAKLKTLLKKLTDQYRLIKDWILSADMGNSGQKMAEKMVENFKGINQYMSENDPQEHKSFHQAFEEASNFAQNAQPDENFNLSTFDTESVRSNQKPSQLGIEAAKILQRKIKNMNEKKAHDQKIKLENFEKPTPLQPSQNQQHSIFGNSSQPEKKLMKTSHPSELSKSQRFHQQALEDPHDNMEHQPMYPPDFQGEQSFLVDEQVQARQKMKKMNQNHPKANTFGIQNLENNTFQYKPVLEQKDQEFQKEIKIIEEFFNNYLCEKVKYAPKEIFFKCKINKKDIYSLYLDWRLKNKGHINLLSDKRKILTKLTKIMKQRYPTCNEERDLFLGLVFKDKTIYRSLANLSQQIVI